MIAFGRNTLLDEEMMRAASVFLAHGSPMSALGGDAHAAALRRFGDAHANVRTILIVSAHWQTSGPLRITAWESAPLIYDFSGFPEELYRMQYPAPGDPVLASRITDRLRAAGHEVMLEATRGLDHGAWVPLLLAWPEARIPVVQLSLADAAPAELLRIGAALGPLRDEGVLVAGSGVIVHNLRRLQIWNKDAPAEPWAAEFDAWVARQVESGDVVGLEGYRSIAPHAALAVPTPEHFDPIFVAVGAAAQGERMATIFDGFQYGTLSMRSFAFG
jgi:4,5-DOPA dioxygenase extradiol